MTYYFQESERKNKDSETTYFALCVLAYISIFYDLFNDESSTLILWPLTISLGLLINNKLEKVLKEGIVEYEFVYRDGGTEENHKISIQDNPSSGRNLNFIKLSADAEEVISQLRCSATRLYGEASR